MLVSQKHALDGQHGGSVTSPLGFSAAGVTCGLKASGTPDLALVYSSRPCTAAGVFTLNRIMAAPCVVSRETLATNPDQIQAVVINAGNANACTGEPGLCAARRTQEITAVELGCHPNAVLVLSTGIIGVQLDVEKMIAGVRQAVGQLAMDNGEAAARAIMTTDTRPKRMATSIDLPHGRVTIGGMAKGSGMIHPNMATMLAVLSTDARAPAPLLQRQLRAAVGCSFNRISVDGDTSTNDSVLLLANGASGVELRGPEEAAAFGSALTEICLALAHEIVRDGEGASRFVQLTVTGTEDAADALAVARTIATSPLVKTAFAGGDPNWGRILAAAGRAGVPFDPYQVGLTVGAGTQSVSLVLGGAPCAFDPARAQAIFAEPEFQISLSLGSGSGQATVWTCDLTHDYVTINADYHT